MATTDDSPTGGTERPEIPLTGPRLTALETAATVLLARSETGLTPTTLADKLGTDTDQITAALDRLAAIELVEDVGDEWVDAYRLTPDTDPYDPVFDDASIAYLLHGDADAPEAHLLLRMLIRIDDEKHELSDREFGPWTLELRLFAGRLGFTEADALSYYQWEALVDAWMRCTSNDFTFAYDVLEHNDEHAMRSENIALYRRCRRKLGLTQAEVADRVGVSQTVVSQVETSTDAVTDANRRALLQFYWDEYKQRIGGVDPRWPGILNTRSWIVPSETTDHEE